MKTIDQELLPNHYVYINVLNCFYKVVGVEPLQYDTGQESTAFFSEVAASGSSDFKNITELNPDILPKMHLFQVVAGVDNDFRYYFKVPTGTSRFGDDVSKGIGFLDTDSSPIFSPNKNFQMWLVKDYYPAINAVNRSTSVPLTPKIRFIGFKYEIQPVKDQTMIDSLMNGRANYKYVIVGGLGGN